MTKPPETIYLQCYDETEELLNLVHDDVTWCVDQINERDATYTLAGYWQLRYEASQRMLARVMRENRVRGECLKVATGALEVIKVLKWYVSIRWLKIHAGSALDEIETRLAQLEPEEEAG